MLSEYNPRAWPPNGALVMNAVVPVPGKSFEEAFDFKEVFATWIARMLARRAPGS
jgi:hypothetical protein